MRKDIKTTLDIASQKLTGFVENPRLEAQLLLAHTLGQSRSHLHAWPERVLSDDERHVFEALLARRLGGEPIAYLTGKREFWSLTLHVGSGVLIPRPETEQLVECALILLPPDQAVRVADLGTGSGAIALALASERPQAQIIATDTSSIALAMARDNARRLGLGRIEFRTSDWFQALGGERFDLIVSNPPYIPEDDPHLLLGDLPAEPRNALSSGADGLDAIRRIVANARQHLCPGGWLLLEHGFDQGAAVRDLLNTGGYAAVKTQRDLGGRERVTQGRQPQDDPTMPQV